MRYLHVIASADPAIGGPAHTLRTRARLARAAGETMGVASWDPANSEALDIHGATTYSLGEGRGRYSWSPEALRRLRLIARGYDILIVHGCWQWSGPVVRRVARELEMPYIQFVHGMLDPWFARAYPLKQCKKLLYWWPIQYPILRDASATCFTSAEELRLARATFRPMHLRPAQVAYGSDAPSTEEVAAGEALREPGRMLHLGRIDRKKGCDILIDAFARVQAESGGLQLAMTGPGPDWLVRELRDHANAAGIARAVEWTDMVTGADKWRQFHRSEVFVLASHAENFGVAVVEALACRVPVIITRKVNIWPIIHRTGCGICVDDTVDSFTRGLRTWLQTSENERNRMRDRARACYEAHFSPRAAKASLDGVLQRALDHHRRRRSNAWACP